ncbi:hypothetical protein NIE88_07775 [Sporolactobacillus shoreicorticis]|uniref:Uncharacterized protein n=1 Tax=Sporolactobacillus shoreicorticis TaxID=1923877 RepID=A0ABW5S762_9BACL|nr:hypothetical protein [Sporolactobacillus shoreicorticis]MCO7125666.1 hypothetical protein [Sporolactobacillus shoreicorticis]
MRQNSTVSLFFTMIFFATLLIPLVNVAIGGWMPYLMNPKMMGRVKNWSTPILILSQSLTLGMITLSFPAYLSVESLFLVVGVVTVFSAFHYYFLYRRIP